MKLERGPTMEDRKRAEIYDRVPDGYNKRGKVLPQTEAAWGQRGAMVNNTIRSKAKTFWTRLLNDRVAFHCPRLDFLLVR